MIQNGSVNVMYSTPSIYVNYVNKDKDFTLSTKSDDFFPYASAPWSYWTGNDVCISYMYTITMSSHY